MKRILIKIKKNLLTSVKKISIADWGVLRKFFFRVKDFLKQMIISFCLFCLLLFVSNYVNININMNMNINIDTGILISSLLIIGKKR
ncbi:hypothetical protein GCM10008906_04940 [Clostridium oceanicum]|uniref:Uncharacterized protein n=1 Tax=Clostridium oceanicum TaxID=1543 RepID=A0ABP3UMQ3_9CLOT